VQIKLSYLFKIEGDYLLHKNHLRLRSTLAERLRISKDPRNIILKVELILMCHIKDYEIFTRAIGKCSEIINAKDFEMVI
jgi:hypothetical protein